MPVVAARLRITTTAVRDPQAVHLRINLRANNDDLADFVGVTLTVTSELADAVAAPWRLIGVAIEMDDGDGLRLLTSEELGPQVQLSASLEAYGRTLNFSRLLPKGSPFKSDLLSGMRRIRATGYLGTSPATMQARTMFDGYLHSATFSSFPPVAQITAQDASILYAEKRLELDIAEGSGRTREAVAIEVLASAGIPYGSLDLGSNAGGIVRKAIQVGGDQNLLEWLRNFITPTGRRMRFNQRGQLDIGTFDETARPVRALRASDVNNLTITTPGTTEANQVRMSGTAVTLVSEALTATADEDGLLRSGFIVSTVVETGDYTPQQATKIQDHLTGTISDEVLPPAEHSAITSKTITATTIEIFDNGVKVTEIVDTYGFYAQRACQFRIDDSAGTLAYNGQFDVYLFGDGSARVVTAETTQHLTQTKTIKFYQVGLLRWAIVDEFKWAPTIANPYIGPAWTSGPTVLVTADRERWISGGGGKDEYSQTLNTFTQYTVAADGQHLASVFETVYDARAFRTVFSDYTYRNTGDPATGRTAETLQTSDHAEQIANLERAVADPQSLVAISTDVVREGLTTTIIAQQQNDFCEGIDELQTAAFYALRELAKWNVEQDMPIDLTLEDGSVYTLPVPVVGGDDEPIVVGGISWQIDGNTSMNSQRVTGYYYPPNLQIR